MADDFDVYDIITTQAFVFEHLRKQRERGDITVGEHRYIQQAVKDIGLDWLRIMKGALLHERPDEYRSQRTFIMNQSFPPEIFNVPAYHELQGLKAHRN